MRKPVNATVPPDDGPAEEQPKWRRDFPIDWADDDYVTRRDLVKFLTLTSLSFTGGHIWLVIKQRGSAADRSAATALEPLAVASLDELPVGGAKVFEFPAGSSPRLLVRMGATEFVAYDQQCTHLLCPVLPEPRDGKLHCPCHNGWFDLATGRPLAGPPRRPLARVTLEIRDGMVWATGVEEGAA